VSFSINWFSHRGREDRTALPSDRLQTGSVSPLASASEYSCFPSLLPEPPRSCTPGQFQLRMVFRQTEEKTSSLSLSASLLIDPLPSPCTTINSCGLGSKGANRLLSLPLHNSTRLWSLASNRFLIMDISCCWAN
jgi:hypothetical protein